MFLCKKKPIILVELLLQLELIVVIQVSEDGKRTVSKKMR